MLRFGFAFAFGGAPRHLPCTLIYGNLFVELELFVSLEMAPVLRLVPLLCPLRCPLRRARPFP